MPTLTFKVSPEEARVIRAKARAEKSTASAFLRARVLDAKPAKARLRVIKRHPVSGLPYDAADEGGPVVTHEQIKAALAEIKRPAGGFVATAPSPKLPAWGARPSQASDAYLAQVAASAGSTLVTFDTDIPGATLLR